MLTFYVFLSCVFLSTGCVERTFTVTTNPPGALVYVNDQPIGPSPVIVPFLYYGKYRIRIEHDGYQTKTFDKRISAPLYAYPPIDFAAENLYPGRILDSRDMYFELEPTQQVSAEELLPKAQDLRERGNNLPEPKKPYQRGGSQNSSQIPSLPPPQPAEPTAGKNDRPSPGNPNSGP